MNFRMKQLRPRGSKILPEILTRQGLRVQELSFRLGSRMAGERQASWRVEVHFAYQMAILRMGRMTRFAAVGALGTVVNLLVMALLLHGVFEINYVVAAVVAAEISILHNFVLQERYVFRDLRGGVHSWRDRLTRHLLFNNAEALVRLPFLILLVETVHVSAVLAQAVTLAIAFVARFLFASRVVYRPRRVTRAARHRAPALRKGRPGTSGLPYFPRTR
jgi:dolichol-phosphate mannosyltransferase